MVSIVIPFYNEAENLQILHGELVKVLHYLREEYEIIFVDDGSIDGSLDIAKKIEKQNKNIRLFSFRKNQGKAEALTLGFTKAKGDYILTLDADLQDKPSEIPGLLDKVKDGFDVVCGWRKERKDPAFKVLSSKCFNILAEKIWGLRLHDYNCGLKIYTKEAAKSLHIYGGLHRFIPLLLHQQGFIVSEKEVIHKKRKFGKSKYGFSKLWKDLPDIFTMFFLIRYSRRPFHFFGVAGMILFLFGIGILGYLSILHFGGETIGRRPLLFFGMMLVLSGFQVFFTGFLADLIINIAYNGKGSNINEGSIIKYSTD